MLQERLSRLLDLVTALQSGRPCSASDLASTLNVHRRTIFRDIKMLRNCGLTIEHDRARGGYQMAGEQLLQSTRFTVDEALSLLVTCEQMGDSQYGIPFQSAARSAAQKVFSALPVGIADQIGNLADSIEMRIDTHAKAPQSESTFELITAAIADGVQIQIDYDSFSNEGMLTTTLAPYRVLFMNRAWYVIGKSDVHGEVRTFRLSRIHAAEATTRPFGIPKGFNLDRYFGNAWRMIREPGVSHDVHIRFQPLVARNVAEVVWHKTQQTEWNADGTLDFRVTLDSLKEVIWWVMGYGKEAVVIEPEELRIEVRQHAEEILERTASV